MRCIEIDRRSDVVFKRIFPSRHANTPFVAGLQSREAPFRMWRYQIVSIKYGKIEKVTRGLNTNGVQSHIFGSSTAIAVPIKSGHRIATTAF